MKDDLVNAIGALRTGQVMRYHAQPDVPCQSNAEHMWGVAMLMLKFYGAEASREMIAAALTHDCGEADIGDIPSPTKCKVPQIRELVKQLEHEALERLELNYESVLRPEEKTALKICDVLEGLHYTAKHYHRTNGTEGGPTLQAWVELARGLPLTKAQRDFMYCCIQAPELRKVGL